MLETRSIPSVLSQSYKNFELLIICDGCTDNSMEVIKKNLMIIELKFF